ncbi:MAG: sodium/glutamate symporter, partial [Campylobacterota bacterium]|nr:sodium/glutamate symporter [Campylobacterota bacterium]
MELINEVLKIDTFLTVTLGIIVLFVGKRVNESFGFLQEYSIPEPVTGGLIFSIVWTILYFVSGISIEFNMEARDVLLVYFFTTIGINANFSDLLRGGKMLLLLVVLTVVYMLMQNFIGIGVASLFDQPKEVGLIGGTISLIGGHGTAIAWAPSLSENYGITNAMEIGVACATFGLILASSIGGPIAKYLIKRHQLKPQESEPLDVGVADSKQKQTITYISFLNAI